MGLGSSRSWSLRRVGWSSSALIPLLLATVEVKAQTALPEIKVSAPSPIVHRAPARPSRPAPAQDQPASQAQPPAPAAETTPQPGTLPIVTDQFATVTVVPNDEIRRS